MPNREVEALREGIEKINAKLNDPANLEFASRVQQSAKRKLKREGTWRHGNSFGTTEKGKLLWPTYTKAGEVVELLKSDDPQTLRWAAFHSFLLGRNATLAKLGPELFDSAEWAKVYKEKTADGAKLTNDKKKRGLEDRRKETCARFAQLMASHDGMSKFRAAMIVWKELGEKFKFRSYRTVLNDVSHR